MPELGTVHRMDDLILDEESLVVVTRLREHLIDMANDYIRLALLTAVAWKREEAALLGATTEEDYSLVAFQRKQASERKTQFFYNAWHTLKLAVGPEIEVTQNAARMPGFSVLRSRSGNIDRDTLEQLEAALQLHDSGATHQLLSTMYVVTAPGFDLDEGRRLMEALL